MVRSPAQVKATSSKTTNRAVCENSFGSTKDIFLFFDSSLMGRRFFE